MILQSKEECKANSFSHTSKKHGAKLDLRRWLAAASSPSPSQAGAQRLWRYHPWEWDAGSPSPSPSQALSTPAALADLPPAEKPGATPARANPPWQRAEVRQQVASSRVDMGALTSLRREPTRKRMQRRCIAKSNGAKGKFIRCQDEKLGRRDDAGRDGLIFHGEGGPNRRNQLD